MSKPPTKNDKDKPRLHLINPRWQLEVAQALALGEEKYGVDNWRSGQGLSVQRIMDAMERHTLAMKMGENTDPESNLSHASHIAACSMMLHYFLHSNGRTPQNDDRKWTAAGAHKALTRSASDHDRDLGEDKPNKEGRIDEERKTDD